MASVENRSSSSATPLVATSASPRRLQDEHGRRFSYLRLSITDACNFKCVYCLPNGYKKNQGAAEPLALSEIQNLVRGFADLGLWKVRLTGGEPTLRRDLAPIIETLREIEGISRLGLSTNGYSLARNAKVWRAAGLHAVNVSIDSLDRETFRAATGMDRLEEVVRGVEAALDAGFEAVKVNAVLLGGLNATHLTGFLDWIRTRPIAVRFIELMPTAQNQELFRQHHLKASVFRDELLAGGWLPRARTEADGPAQEFTHADYQGRIGIIAPYAQDFCHSCNRLRVTSQGLLRLCLFGNGGHSLRPYLQSPEQKPELLACIREVMKSKDASHSLQEGLYGDNSTFSAMGG